MPMSYVLITDDVLHVKSMVRRGMSLSWQSALNPP